MAAVSKHVAFTVQRHLSGAWQWECRVCGSRLSAIAEHVGEFLSTIAEHVKAHDGVPRAAAVTYKFSGGELVSMETKCCVLCSSVAVSQCTHPVGGTKVCGAWLCATHAEMVHH